MTQVKDGVVIGYLSGGDTRVEFTRSIGAVTAHSISKGLPLVGALPHISGPRIASGRNHLVEAFLASPGEWLFMVDDDMAFDGDVVERFLAVADKDKAPIVGGLTFGVGRDGMFPTLFRVSEQVQAPIRMEQWPLGETVEVDATGAACLFIHRSVFEKMAEQYDKPWQWFQETTLGANTVGEDMTFCLRARAMGIPIIVDTSIRFGHVKTRVITEDEYFRWLDTHRFVVTGTGRCGLAYAANAFLYNRIRVGYHEMFTIDGKDPNPFLRGDVSWSAPPYLDHFTGYVLHIVRHPAATVLSLAETEPDEEILGFVKEHEPEVLEYEGLERAAAWYLAWNRRIEPYAHRRLQVENMVGDDLVDVIRYAGAYHAPWEIQQNLSQIPIPEQRAADWDLIPDGPLKTELQAMGEAYGYAV